MFANQLINYQLINQTLDNYYSETIAYIRHTDHMSEMYQSAYKPHHSTDTALLCVCEEGIRQKKWYSLSLRKHGQTIHHYADDLQIYAHFQYNDQSIYVCYITNMCTISTSLIIIVITITGFTVNIIHLNHILYNNNNNIQYLCSTLKYYILKRLSNPIQSTYNETNTI